MKLEWRPISLTEAGPGISTSLTELETKKLQWLAAGAEVLEIGSAYGYSAVAMALAAAQVTAVDPHAWLQSYDLMMANLQAYEVEDRVSIIRSSSHDYLPSLLNSGKQFDLAWIDGDHGQAAVELDVALSLQLLRPGTGVLACHDWDEDTCPGVRAALEATLGWPHELVDTLAIYYLEKMIQ